MAYYSDDDDLIKYRPDIFQLGVDSFDTQRAEAYDQINRIIRIRWYNKAAPEMGYDPIVTAFDPDLIQASQIKLAEVYKTLSLAYGTMKKAGAESDGFERFEKDYAKLFNEEMELILAGGINYDWSGSGEYEDEELYVKTSRRLIRA